MEACWCSQLISLFQWPLTSSHVDISTGPNLHDFEAAIVFVWNRQTLTAEQIAPIATWLMPAPCSALHMHPHSTHESQQSFINNWQYYNHTFTNIKKTRLVRLLLFLSHIFLSENDDVWIGDNQGELEHHAAGRGTVLVCLSHISSTWVLCLSFIDCFVLVHRSFLLLFSRLPPLWLIYSRQHSHFFHLQLKVYFNCFFMEQCDKGTSVVVRCGFIWVRWKQKKMQGAEKTLGAQVNNSIILKFC